MKLLNDFFLSLFTNLFSSVFICNSKETQVYCVFNERCVLPCSFQSGKDPVIHWVKTPEQTYVHIYYNTQDQVQYQHQDFKGRTSLFEDQISRGNISLLLREVKLQDEGRYECYANTVTIYSKESFINLTVSASVSFVSIEQRGDELICSSKDIYPKPNVSWSLRPSPPDVEPNTSVSESEKGLYSIFSSVRLSHKPPEEHSCNISTDHSWSSATYRLQLLKSISGELTVPCSASNAPIKSLIWKFNHTQTILNQTGTNRVYNESWRQFVEEVSESGRLTLKNLSSGHQGVYSCYLSSDRETLISSTEVREEDPQSTTGYVLLGVFLFVTILIISVLWWKRQKVLQRRREIEERCREIEGERRREIEERCREIEEECCTEIEERCREIEEERRREIEERCRETEEKIRREIKERHREIEEESRREIKERRREIEEESRREIKERCREIEEESRREIEERRREIEERRREIKEESRREIKERCRETEEESPREIEGRHREIEERRREIEEESHREIEERRREIEEESRRGIEERRKAIEEESRREIEELRRELEEESRREIKERRRELEEESRREIEERRRELEEESRREIEEESRREIEEESRKALKALRLKELFPKYRSPSDRPEKSDDTQTGGNQSPFELPSQDLRDCLSRTKRKRVK